MKHRVVTMHASDRYLAEGTIEDLRQGRGLVGYAKRLRHGEIGKGMNDYDAIFSELAGVGFDGWISIEDGVDGIEQLRRQCRFPAPQDRAALAPITQPHDNRRRAEPPYVFPRITADPAVALRLPPIIPLATGFGRPREVRANGAAP